MLPPNGSTTRRQSVACQLPSYYGLPLVSHGSEFPWAIAASVRALLDDRDLGWSVLRDGSTITIARPSDSLVADEPLLPQALHRRFHRITRVGGCRRLSTRTMSSSALTSRHAEVMAQALRTAPRSKRTPNCARSRHMSSLLKARARCQPLVLGRRCPGHARANARSMNVNAPTSGPLPRLKQSNGRE